MGKKEKFPDISFELIAEAYNYMHYDAVGLGETDLGRDREWLPKMAEKTDFPVLLSNISQRNISAKPYTIIQLKGVRAGVLAVNPENADAQDGLQRISPEKAVSASIPQLQKDADLVILLSGLAKEETEQLVSRIPSIHIAVIGRGTGGTNAYTVNDTILFGAAPLGDEIAGLEIRWDKNKKYIVDYDNNRYFLGDFVAQDEDIYAIFDKYSRISDERVSKRYQLRKKKQIEHLKKMTPEEFMKLYNDKLEQMQGNTHE